MVAPPKGDPVELEPEAEAPELRCQPAIAAEFDAGLGRERFRSCEVGFRLSDRAFDALRMH